ncbi:MAG: iron export ABC transporter permease subunit FetB [Planctomycetota bacterium]
MDAAKMIELTPLDLGIAAFLLVALAACSVILQLNLAQRLVIAAVRTTVQLLLIGFVLRWLFAVQHPGWVLGLGLVMVLLAGREVHARQRRRVQGIAGWFVGTGAMLVSSFVISIYALTMVIEAEPWYAARYAIPLLGILLGNTMNGISLGTDRLTSLCWQQRAAIEQRLLLGQGRDEALRDIRQESMRAGLIPIINAMAAAGIVSLPGTMTGQLLAGAAPLDAVRYQILIMFLIAAGTGFGTLLAVWQTGNLLFDERQRLRLDRLQGEG